MHYFRRKLDKGTKGQRDKGTKGQMKRSDKLKLIGEAVMLYLSGATDEPSDHDIEEHDDVPHLDHDLDLSQLDDVTKDEKALKSLISGTKVDVLRRGYYAGTMRTKLDEKSTVSDKDTKDIISLMDALNK